MSGRPDRSSPCPDWDKPVEMLTSACIEKMGQQLSVTSVGNGYKHLASEYGLSEMEVNSITLANPCFPGTALLRYIICLENSTVRFLMHKLEKIKRFDVKRTLEGELNTHNRVSLLVVIKDVQDGSKKLFEGNINAHCQDTLEEVLMSDERFDAIPMDELRCVHGTKDILKSKAGEYRSQEVSLQRRAVKPENLVQSSSSSDHKRPVDGYPHSEVSAVSPRMMKQENHPKTSFQFKPIDNIFAGMLKLSSQNSIEGPSETSTSAEERANTTIPMENHRSKNLDDKHHVATDNRQLGPSEIHNGQPNGCGNSLSRLQPTNCDFPVTQEYLTTALPGDYLEGFCPQAIDENIINGIFDPHIHQDGFYIIRPSRNDPVARCISVVFKRNVVHYRIHCNKLNATQPLGYYVFLHDPRFSSIDALIQYYSAHKLRDRGEVDGPTLRRPVPSPTRWNPLVHGQ